MHIEVYILATLIGLSLGLIGGGGSVLTLPVLVYLLGIPPLIATGYSLFIVGVTSLAGAVRYAQNHLLAYKTALVFGLPSILAVYFTRKILLPRIPDPVIHLHYMMVSKPVFIMVLFAVLMILASVAMILPVKEDPKKYQLPWGLGYVLLLAEGIAVGILTGLVGAGGGFLIIPALVLMAKLPMKTAVGTSLLIIALKSLIGFTGDLSHQVMDWNLLLVFTLFAILGMLVGITLSKRISGEKLKPVFGWFVLVMGVFILFNELYFKP